MCLSVQRTYSLCMCLYCLHVHVPCTLYTHLCTYICTAYVHWMHESSIVGACACAVWVYNSRSIRLTTEDPQNHFLSSDVLQIRIACYITYAYSIIADRRCLEIGLYQASVLVLKGVYCTYTHILLLYMPCRCGPCTHVPWWRWYTGFNTETQPWGCGWNSHMTTHSQC